MYAPEIMDILLIFFFHFHPQFLKHGHILITCSTTCTYLKYSAKFQIPALKIVRLRGVDFKKLVGFMVLNATFKQYFSYINLWRSVLLVQETGVPGEKSLTCRKSLTNLINILLY
jgi:hypothetical protein